MKKRFYPLVVILFTATMLFFLSFTVMSVSLADESYNPVLTPIITLEDTVRDFSQVGYTPKAEINIEELRVSIQYVAIRKSDSAPVSFPIKDAGEYYIRAFLPATKKYNETETIATLIINPIEAHIVVDYHKEKYNGIANPPKWRIEPEWASDYINISESYYEMEDEDSADFRPTDVPKNLGFYYVLLSPYNMNGNFICNQKTFIYEIGVDKGEKLPEDEAKSSVPSSFKCEMEELKVVYNGDEVKMPYKAYPQIANYKIEYKNVDYTGASGEFTTKAPTEPGEYHVRATLLGQPISESILIIEKITPSFKIETAEYEYTPLGIIPKVTSILPNNIKYTVSAYLVNDSNVAGSKPVQIPIKEAGRYLIIVNPTDLAHYNSVFTSEYITIKQAIPRIYSTDQDFIYDGLSKTPSYTVNPDWAEANITYYMIDELGSVIEALGNKPPIYIGNYYAIITVDETPNVAKADFQIKMSITSVKAESMDESKANFVWLGNMKMSSVFLLIGLPLILIAGILVFITRTQKSK
ncbi:MAG: hypothetical protein PHV95_08095 [Eubacteriales bacterium]|nr:hypothetical protein [Eubacteriales bacterium]